MWIFPGYISLPEDIWTNLPWTHPRQSHGHSLWQHSFDRDIPSSGGISPTPCDDNGIRPILTSLRWIGGHPSWCHVSQGNVGLKKPEPSILVVFFLNRDFIGSQHQQIVWNQYFWWILTKINFQVPIYECAWFFAKNPRLLGSNFLRHRFWSWKVLSVNMCQVSFIRPPNKHKQTIPSNFFGALIYFVNYPNILKLQYSSFRKPLQTLGSPSCGQWTHQREPVGKPLEAGEPSTKKLREKSIGNNKFHLKSEGEKKTETATHQHVKSPSFTNNHFPWEKLNVLPKMLLLVPN